MHFKSLEPPNVRALKKKKALFSLEKLVTKRTNVIKFPQGFIY